MRAVGFDLDGTLFDHRGSAQIGVTRFLGSLGVVPTEVAVTSWFAAEDKQYELWRSGSITFQEQRRERLRVVLPMLGVETPTDDAGLDLLFAEYLDFYRRSWRLFPDSLALLQRLRSQGYRVGLLTNGTQEQQLDKLLRTGLVNLFDAVCTSERIGVQKPDPRAFVVLAVELGVEPTTCLFVGDNPTHDVEGARAAGMRGLLVDRYGQHLSGIVELVTRELAAEA